MSDRISYTCSACGKHYQVPLSAAGKIAACKCGVRSKIPSAPPTPIDESVAVDESTQTDGASAGAEPTDIVAQKQPTITVEREKKFINSGHPCVIYIDGYIAGDVTNGNSNRFKLAHGKHTIFFKCCNVVSKCYEVDLSLGEYVIFECGFEEGSPEFHWTKYKTRGPIREIPLPDNVCDIPPELLAKIRRGGTREKLIWERTLWMRNSIIIFAILTAIDMLLFTQTETRYSMKDGEKTHFIDIGGVRIPIWIIGVIAITSIAGLVGCFVVSLRRKITITTKRTIFQTGRSASEILHVDLAAITILTVDNIAIPQVQVATLTIKSKKEGDPTIVVQDTVHARYIKNILDEFKIQHDTPPGSTKST